MALAAKELDVVGITTVGGNVAVDITTRNALRLTALAGRKIPVARGADQALVVPTHRAESIHGSDGLGGVNIWEGMYALSRSTQRWALTSTGWDLSN